MSYLLLSRLFLGVFLTSANEYQTRGSIDNVAFSTQLSLHVFSDKTNKLSGYAVGKYLAYTIPTFKKHKINSVEIAFNYKNLSKIRSDERFAGGKFGNAFTLIGLLNFSALNNQKLKLTLSPGMGMSYLDDTWYSNNNPVISSHLNFSPTARLLFSFGLDRYTLISTSFSIIHYSNAAMRIPNHGLNIVDLNLGIIKQFIQGKVSESAQDKDDEFKEHAVELGVNTGIRGAFYEKKNSYKTGAFLGYIYRVNPFFGLSAGFDGVYYHSLFDSKRHTLTYQSKATSFTRWRLGVAIGPTISMSKVSWTGSYGHYLYFRSYHAINSYWNTSFKYKLNKLLAFQAKLYVHREEVDFLGFGLAFNLGL